MEVREELRQEEIVKAQEETTKAQELQAANRMVDDLWPAEEIPIDLQISATHADRNPQSYDIDTSEIIAQRRAQADMRLSGQAVQIFSPTLKQLPMAVFRQMFQLKPNRPQRRRKTFPTRSTLRGKGIRIDVPKLTPSLRTVCPVVDMYCYCYPFLIPQYIHT